MNQVLDLQKLSYSSEQVAVEKTPVTTTVTTARTGWSTASNDC